MFLHTLIPPTAKRVQLRTKNEDNQMILEKTLSNIEAYRNKSRQEILERINALDKEWDTERILETTAASIFLFTTILGFQKNKRWFALNGIAGIFLLQHALQGWCPPLPIIRKLGIRTSSEINEEKTALQKIYDSLE